LPQVTEMLLLRHGQSTWNAQQRWQGQADPPLSDLGRAQAAHAGQRLGAVDAIVSSPLERAHATAHILAEAIGVGPVEVVPALAERDAGPWSGLTRDEIDERWPGFLREQKRPDGYELDPELLDRIGAALDGLADRFGRGQLLVVCHGGVINAIERTLGEPWVRLANLDGRWITIEPGSELTQWHLGPRIQLVDDDELSETPKDMV
jgi:probable phosphoglycerate mutase